MSELIKEGNKVTVKTGVAIKAENVESLRLELKQALEEGADQIVIDLWETDIIDSIGLGLLAATHNSLSKKGSKLEVINAREQICKVLNLMRLDRHFVISCKLD